MPVGAVSPGARAAGIAQGPVRALGAHDQVAAPGTEQRRTGCRTLLCPALTRPAAAGCEGAGEAAVLLPTVGLVRDRGATPQAEPIIRDRLLSQLEGLGL